MDETTDRARTIGWFHQQCIELWPWAIENDGLVLLNANDKLEQSLAAKMERWRDPQAEADYEEARLSFEIERFHFISTIGEAAVRLKWACATYPELEPHLQKAAHLFTEGRELRNMTVHVDEYFEGRGHQQSRFERSDVIQGVTADASSTVINEHGLWLGGRFNVQIAISEARALQVICQGLIATGPRIPS
ncbi:hypothetical protein [Glycocaulis sp.]|uniref:hypothetical protein n=1 Tax=Glycocaulis sp. TaxID=1969725 RepID=UPI003D252FC3